MKEYDLSPPLYYNDGSPVELNKFQQLQETLLEQFGGLTFFPQPNHGYWRMGNVTYRDEIVIYRVVSGKSKAARRFLADLKQRLKRSFRQEEIFIVERKVDTV